MSKGADHVALKFEDTTPISYEYLLHDLGKEPNDVQAVIDQLRVDTAELSHKVDVLLELYTKGYV